MNEDAIAETRYYLELNVEDLRSGPAPERALSLGRLGAAEAGQARWLYGTVGAAWNWVDRAGWTTPQWAEQLSRPEVELWQLSDSEEPAGYFELRREAAERVEIAALGLVPASIGRGLGAHLLTLAVRRAAAAGASLVWLHTSSRDHPHALANYQSRGFRLTRTEAL